MKTWDQLGKLSEEEIEYREMLDKCVGCGLTATITFLCNYCAGGVCGEVRIDGERFINKDVKLGQN